MDTSKVSIFKTYDKPRGQGGASSFATFMIIGPVCFFLGILFSSFPYDYPLLWTTESTPDAYYNFIEEHLKFMHASPPIIPRILHIVVSVGFIGLFTKLFKPSEANLLFDGASLVLYVVGVVVYITNIVKGMRIVTLGLYGEAGAPEGEVGVGREDSLRVLAASNTILALVLVGVLVLQAGQWYAERKDQDEVEKYEKEEQEKKELEKKQRSVSGHVTRSVSKKRQ
ncbi:hypothetical protein EAF04_005476 [Stromatinia cepivora]|nr:hypothetical protein EAF04_005476 [Stromatinia cepivora]